MNKRIMISIICFFSILIGCNNNNTTNESSDTGKKDTTGKCLPYKPGTVKTDTSITTLSPPMTYDNGTLLITYKFETGIDRVRLKIPDEIISKIKKEYSSNDGGLLSEYAPFYYETTGTELGALEYQIGDTFIVVPCNMIGKLKTGLITDPKFKDIIVDVESYTIARSRLRNFFIKNYNYRIPGSRPINDGDKLLLNEVHEYLHSCDSMKFWDEMFKSSYSGFIFDFMNKKDSVLENHIFPIRQIIKNLHNTKENLNLKN